MNWLIDLRSTVKRKHARPSLGTIKGAYAHGEDGFGYPTPVRTSSETKLLKKFCWLGENLRRQTGIGRVSGCNVIFNGGNFAEVLEDSEVLKSLM